MRKRHKVSQLSFISSRYCNVDFGSTNKVHHARSSRGRNVIAFGEGEALGENAVVGQDKDT
jgi:hypothetical protein